ncbi:MAG: response regulator transcription factor [Bacteroidota bacterium]
MNQLRILVVEDDIFIAEDICETLEQMEYIVVGPAYNATDAIELLDKEKLDLALLDINLGEGANGISLGHLIQESYHLPFIYLTSYANKSTLESAKKTRPMGYVVKPFQVEDLFAAIEIALYNYSQRWQPVSWQPTFLNKKLNTDFTPKESEILQDMFEGKTNAQLAEKHFVSPNTIKTHVKRIYEKLEVHTRSEAIAKLRAGLE